MKKLLTIALVGLLTLVMATTALAAEPFMETGTVVSIGADSFELDVAGTIYTVFPPEGFDLSTLAVDDTVQVEGEVEEGVVTASSVLIVLEEGPEPFMETGTVVTKGIISFEMDVEGTIYTVFPPEGFDLETLAVDDTVEVEGEVEDGIVTATSIVIVTDEEGPEPFMETGTVVSIGESSFEMDVEGTIYTILPPEGFDLATLAVDDTVEVEGEVEEGVVAATSIVIVTDEEEEEEVEYLKDGYYCENPDASHPALQKVADRHGADYEEVLAFFCGTDEVGHNGVGGIMLAYKTSETLGDETTAAEILQMKEELGGWGKVWQYYGLKGNKHGQTEGPEDGDTEEPEIEEPGIEEDSTFAKNGKNKNTGKGKPAHAGPPDHANNDKDKNKDKNKEKNNNKNKNKKP